MDTRCFQSDSVRMLQVLVAKHKSEDLESKLKRLPFKTTFNLQEEAGLWVLTV